MRCKCGLSMLEIKAQLFQRISSGTELRSDVVCIPCMGVILEEWALQFRLMQDTLYGEELCT